MENDLPIENGFYEEFDFQGKKYIAHIQHYLNLPEDEIINYRVIDGEFLIHLYSLDGCKTFKVFLDEQLIWQTNTSKFLVPPEMIEVIGFVIDMKEFYP